LLNFRDRTPKRSDRSAIEHVPEYGASIQVQRIIGQNFFLKSDINFDT
jgi:hypothetical protein